MLTIDDAVPRIRPAVKIFLFIRGGSGFLSAASCGVGFSSGWSGDMERYFPRDAIIEALAAMIALIKAPEHVIIAEIIDSIFFLCPSSSCMKAFFSKEYTVLLLSSEPPNGLAQRREPQTKRSLKPVLGRIALD